MASKLEYYSNLAVETASSLTKSRDQWTAFLRTAGRVNKYSFEDQSMIFAQRPDATACAEYDLWNDRMHRYVKRGSKGIALIDNNGDYPRLRYVFDVSDTGTRANSRDVNAWQMLPEHEQTVKEALSYAFVVQPYTTFEVQIENIAHDLAINYWLEHEYEFADIVEGSRLEEYDDDNRRMSFLNAAAVSIKYEVMSRCVENPDDYCEPDEFVPVTDYNTFKSISALGTAVSDASRLVLREIEIAIRGYERIKQIERSNDYGTDLHAERRLPYPEHRPEGYEQGAAGQVRENAPDIPAGTQADPVQRAVHDREAVPTPERDRRDSTPEDGSAHGRAAGEGTGTGQEDTADGLGTAHEQPEGTGGGNRAERAGFQLSSELPEVEQISFLLPGIPSEAEQIEAIDHTAESEQLSAVPFSQEDIDHPGVSYSILLSR